MSRSLAYHQSPGPFSPDLDDYSFVFDDWTPPADVPVVGWSRTTHLGLPYVLFRISGSALEVECRIDPCTSPDAMTPYTAMVRRDLLHEHAKAIRLNSTSNSPR